MSDGPAWRRAFRRITLAHDPEMHIVTTAAGGRRAGCLVGFATQASIDPPRMLIGLSVTNHTHTVAADATAMAIHCPPAGARGLATLFGTETGDDTDKFARCEWRVGPRGVPLLAGCPTWMVGDIVARLPLGDHTGVLCHIVAAHDGGDGPWLRFAEVRDLPPGHAP